MQVVSIISTKGGVGQRTTTAAPGRLRGDAGCACCCWICLDVQHTLSSHNSSCKTRASAGIYELLAFNEQD